MVRGLLSTIGRAVEPSNWPLSRTWTILLVGLVFAVELLASEPRGWLVDFKNAYYPAGVASLHGQDLLGVIQKGVAGFVNLPIVAYVFAPFALLSWQPAGAILSLLGIAVAAAAYVVLVRAAELTGPSRIWLLLLFLCNGPLISSIKAGNTSQVAILAVAIAMYWVRTGRSIASGVLLGLTAILKLPLLLLGGYFVLRREWRGAAAFATVIVAVSALSLAVFGIALHVAWLDTAVLQFGSNTIPAFNVQSAPAMIARLRNPAPPLFDWSMVGLSLNDRLVIKTIQAAIAALTLFAFWQAHLAARNARLAIHAAQLQLALLFCCALLISPLAWSHYYCWLLAPAALLVGQRSGFGASRAALRTGWAAVLLTTPLVVYPYRFTSALDPLYTKLVVSNYFIGGVVWLIALTLAARALRRSDLVSSAGQRAAA